MAGARPRVAIVGAGPAGAFAAACLLRARGDAEIDLFERLPTPWGLLRGGVAPDHQEIKRLEDTFDRQTLARGCRFFGNVEVGVDVSHSELMRHYTAVIYATGAQTDKSLGIPGEDLPGSWAATEFVAWYNGHPDYRELEFDLSARRAVVIGNGNVAADVTRMLTLSAGRARAHGRRRPRPRGAAREPHRGGHRARPARPGAGGVHQRRAARARPPRRRRRPGRPRRRRARPGSREWLAEQGTFTARKNVELLREFAARPARPDAGRRIELRFLRSPVEIRGDGRVEAIDVRPNELARDGDGRLIARPLSEAARPQPNQGAATAAGPYCCAFGVVLGVGLLAVLLGSAGVRRRAGVGGMSDPRAVALVLALLAVGSLAASPVENAISRRIETRADVDALEVTGDPEAFIALQRALALRALADPSPPAWSQLWFGSHPTVVERVAVANVTQ